MKIRVLIALAAVFSAFGVGVSSSVQTANGANRLNLGARCAIQPFQTAYKQSNAVFVGEVVGDEKSGDVRRLEFKVEKYWKGSKKKKAEVFVYETARFQSWFKKGGRYLIYANADDGGKLQVSRCSRSSDLESAAEDLKKLGKGKIPR